jgi:hypothetical protein
MSGKFLRRTDGTKRGEQMTDQPNPVGLKKEISGHPTDHSRKALDFCDEHGTTKIPVCAPNADF